MFRHISKKILQKINPSYRVALRLEEENSLLFKKVDSLERLLRKTNVQLNQYGTQNQMLFWWQLASGAESLREVKKDFFLKMPAADYNLRLVQLGNALLLSKLKKICDDNDIRIWLNYGTLLGAVRHKGFIPWDDDIDVGIMRTDLNKLRTIIKNYPEYELAEGYYISSTVGCFTRFIVQGFRVPLFVDLGVFDYCSLPAEEATWKLIGSIRKKFVGELNDLKPTLKGNYNIPDSILTPAYAEDVTKIKEICKRYEGILGNEENSQSIYWAIDSTNPVYSPLINKSLVFPLSKIEFEGQIYNAPGELDIYLRQQYNDYYEIPINVGTPVHKEFAHYDKYYNEIEKYLEENQ